ncbi:MAG: LptA/OstA family protein [Terriglobales bacterium]
MGLPVSRLRQWFALGAILMIATVAGMYFYARWRVRTVVHDIPAKIGLDIQQTAEGFSISKSVEGRTLFTVSASKAVQFKGGGRAELHDVKIVVYGKSAGRFDRITGDDFEYDPASGDVSAKGTVLIDLEANPEGMRHSDQTPPEQTSDPIHLETNGLVFNKNTGNASARGKVVFQTPQASGSATGIEYVAKTSTMNLLSAVEVAVSQPQAARLNADHGLISKQPRQIALSGVRLTRAGQRLQSDQATFFLRDDNTVERVLAEGNVRSEFHGRALSRSSSKTSGSEMASARTSNSEAQGRSDRAELFLAGVRNQLTTAVLSGNVQLASGDAASRVSTGGQSQGAGGFGTQTAEASAGRVTLRFGGQQVLETVHAEDGVRLMQKKAESAAAAGPFDFAQGRLAGAPVAPLSGSDDAQEVEMTAPVMDFIVKDGRRLERAETSGPPQIVITQPGANQKTMVTAAKFTAKFTEKNRLATLHGEPEAKIVSSKVVSGKGDENKINENKIGGAPGQDRVSTSQMLDVIFRPEGGVRSITQTGRVAYVDGPQKAWAERGEYTTADQMLVLSGSPRVVDNGMTTTAQTIRMSRATGDAIAEGNVKSTYSDLKAQPEGGMFASSDPIHVASRSMMAHRSPAIAVYTGDARLWQNANVVEAPRLQFDRDRRSLLAQGVGTGPRSVRAGESPAPTQASPTQVPGQPVSTVLVQVDKSGKATPVRITSGHLNYVDAERKIVLDGGVTAKGSDATLTGQQMTVFLLPQSQTPQSATAGPGTAGQVERIVAEGKVVITQPTRHATGDRLVYTAAEDKFVLTGGPPSIFDAERGKITGDSLTFFRHDDRVLVEGRETSPTITKTQVAR